MSRRLAGGARGKRSQQCREGGGKEKEENRGSRSSALIRKLVLKRDGGGIAQFTRGAAATGGVGGGRLQVHLSRGCRPKEALKQKMTTALPRRPAVPSQSYKVSN
jgi:hypothetical protein